jgi:hypothetical protein
MAGQWEGVLGPKVSRTDVTSGHSTAGQWEGKLGSKVSRTQGASARLDGGAMQGMLGPQVSRTDEANGRMALVSQEMTRAQKGGYPEPATECETAAPDSSRRTRSADGTDANERALLIHVIGRLIRGPAVPDSTRLAGLTLIGWLARRRPDEPAHAVGVEEARQSERLWQAARTKAR